MKTITAKVRLFLLTWILLAIMTSGCSDYRGRYGDLRQNGRSIAVGGDSIKLETTVDGSYASNQGRIGSATKSPDGKTVTLTGEIDYSGGSGTSFGVTVLPGQERHWTKPFSATVSIEEKTMHFQGTFIVDSMNMRAWDVTLKKQ